METTAEHSCHCQAVEPVKRDGSLIRKVGRAGKPLPSVLMSLMIAFFPKCPLCWAIYMSLFSSVGLARLPYMPWLLPVLVVLLAFHLLFLLRRARQQGYQPFLLGTAGAALILTSRVFFPDNNWLLDGGMLLLVSSSLMNSFSGLRLPLKSFKTH